MDSRKAIVVHDRCNICEYVKSILKEKGIDVDFIDAGTKEGKEYADKHKIAAVPTCLVITPAEEAANVRECTVDEFRELLERKKK